MDGFDLEKFHVVILDAFNRPTFGRLLLHRLNFDLDDYADKVGLSEAADVALRELNKLGLLPKLAIEMALARPLKPKAQALYREFGAQVASMAARADVDREVRQAYARFFDGRVPVELQQQGTTLGAVPLGDTGLERTVREDLGYVDAAQWANQLLLLQGRVCRVELNDDVGTMGTGFLVAPDLVLTNYHVLEAVIERRHLPDPVRFRFDYKTLPDGSPAEGVLTGLKPGEPEVWLLGHAKYSPAELANTQDLTPPTANELDYALVRLDAPLGSTAPAAGGPPRGWIQVPAAQPALAGLPALLILQHPNRAPLKLAFDTHPSIALIHEGRRVRYATNTEAGSSGSPCFDVHWELVALHHYGDPAFLHPQYNQGIPIAKIREHLGEAARRALGGPP